MSSKEITKQAYSSQKIDIVNTCIDTIHTLASLYSSLLIHVCYYFSVICVRVDRLCVI